MASIDLHAMGARDKRELLRALLSGSAASPQTLRAAPDSRFEPFPLTQIQQAYWLGRDPQFPLGGVGIHGYFELDCVDLDVPRLQSAWSRIIEHHDMLRAVVLPDGRSQVLERPPAYRIPVEDMRGMSPLDIEARRQELRARMAHQVFDVTLWPLFDIRVIRIDARTTRLHYSEDAIHVDMMSSARVFADWIRLYRHPEAELTPQSVSYRDYAIALRARMDTEADAPARAYWRARIDELPEPPRIPLSVPLESVKMNFVRRKYLLAAPQWRALQASAAQHGLTPSDVLLACYAEVLGQWSESSRFIMNVTIQNRLPLHPEVAQIVGDFTSFTLLEVDTGRLEAFVERAMRFRDQLWRDLEHREYSGVSVLREIGKQRNQADFMVPYVFTSSLGTAGYRELGELGEIVCEITQTPQVLIDQQVLEVDGGLVLSWDAVDSAFPPRLISDMFADLSRRIEELRADPGAWTRVRRPALPPDQQSRRAAMNDTQAAFRSERLEDTFARCLPGRAGDIAICDARGVLSYADLDRESWQVCNGLLAQLAPCGEEPVAIALPKSRQQIIAVLGILKTGRAYLPLDISHPAPRIASILSNAGCRLAIVEPESKLSLPATVATFALHHSARYAAEPVATAPGTSRRDARAAAYVMYTSGSSGEPKGVMISHDSIANRMQEVVERFAIRSSDRVLGITALHHDLSVFDIFGMLVFAGGTLVIPPSQILDEPSRWPEYLRVNRVSIWNSVPGFVELLLAYAENAAQPEEPVNDLKWALIAGDFIPRNLPRRLRQLAPNAAFMALGGPTETTVWDICHPCERASESRPHLPYGRPMRNARYFVMRDDLSECPDWVPGELCIGGVGLMLGYVGDAALTSQLMVAHPISGERLYRSGDRGLINDEGIIHILGRMDRQVKINGQRIGLQEIEAALRRHPQVVNSVVLASNDAPPQLRAYVTHKPRTVQRVCSAPGRVSVAGIGEPVLAAAGRYSARGFEAGAVPFEKVAALLETLGETPQSARQRRYPSAGACYAVELYLYAQASRVSGLEGGLYRFDPASLELIRCERQIILDARAHAPWNAALAEQSAFTLLLVAELQTLREKYAEWSRDLCLVESGYMGQLAACAAAELGVSLCPIGGLQFDDHLGLFPASSSAELVHCLVGGLPQRVALARQSALPVNGVLSAGALREFLRNEIPQHMIPSQIFLVDSLPLNSNGKVDRSRLALPLQPPPAAAAAHELRTYISTIIAEIIGNEVIGSDKVFQELGLSSIHFVQLHARLRAGGHRLDKADLFTYPSIDALARYLAAGDGALNDDLEQVSRRHSQRRDAASHARSLRRAT